MRKNLAELVQLVRTISGVSRKYPRQNISESEVFQFYRGISAVRTGGPPARNIREKKKNRWFRFTYLLPARNKTLFGSALRLSSIIRLVHARGQRNVRNSHDRHFGPSVSIEDEGVRIKEFACSVFYHQKLPSSNSQQSLFRASAHNNTRATTTPAWALCVERRAEMSRVF